MQWRGNPRKHHDDLNSVFFETIVAWKNKSCNLCKRRFCRILVFQIHRRFLRLVGKVRSAGSFFDKKYTTQNALLTKELLNESGARLEHWPRKSLPRLAQPVESDDRLTSTAVWNRQVQVTAESDYERRLYDWSLWAAYDCVLDQKLTFLTYKLDSIWVGVSVLSRYWSTVNPRQNFKAPLHDQKIAVWCAAARIVGPSFSECAINS